MGVEFESIQALYSQGEAFCLQYALVKQHHGQERMQLSNMNFTNQGVKKHAVLRQVPLVQPTTVDCGFNFTSNGVQKCRLVGEVSQCTETHFVYVSENPKWIQSQQYRWKAILTWNLRPASINIMAMRNEEIEIKTGPAEGGSVKLGLTPGGGIAAGVWTSCSGVIPASVSAMVE